MMQVLRGRSLAKSFRKKKVVDDVTIEVREGEVVGLLGPNGAGKTTTFHMVVGLTRPDSGSVYLDDQEITEFPMYLRARSGISYLPQEPSIFRKLTVEENALAILETLSLDVSEKRRRLAEVLEELGLTDKARSRGYTLSGGERRRAEITRALVTSPAFMLLDEPFAGIDPIAVGDIQRIVQHLKTRGIGILVTDHNVRETLKITDRAYIMNDGKILCSGTPEELAENEDVRRVYFGEDFRLD
ncbi:MAG TPA: LPS export ABC transporter ATP-binding protein [Vicinamibacteria bacterium]|nr:LPS export ABC transporter ATP-binding protein [Vicinamibacteria bacterium]